VAATATAASLEAMERLHIVNTLRQVVAIAARPPPCSRSIRRRSTGSARVPHRRYE
jgi:hypothetical protein